MWELRANGASIMGYRIHTASAMHTGVQHDTIANVDEHLGYEYDGNGTEKVLIFNDGGNQEAWVFIGTTEDFVNLADRLLEVIDLTTEDDDDEAGCEGHESLAGEHMGETVYCDGTCKTR
jgi:hypothetical protein